MPACKKCDGIADIDPSVIFEIEGIFDRQMDNGIVPNSAEFALRERLKHWFDQTEKAKAKYKITTTQVNPEKDYSSLNKTCPYNIDIDRKLKLAHSKLSESAYLF